VDRRPGTQGDLTLSRPTANRCYAKNVISKLEFLSNNLFFDFGGYLFRRLRYQILAIYVGTRVMNMTVMFLFFVLICILLTVF
jgi:hypothetical protein